MPKRISIEPHLSLRELEQRYRQAKKPVERSHYQIIWLLASGRSSREVSQITGYSLSWIYELVWGYNRIGPKSLGDKRHEHQGADTLLNDVQQAQLWQALQSPPTVGGLWNGQKVANWMSELLGHSVSRQRGWEYLKAMRLRLRVPRPSHQEADFTEQEKWKKKLAKTVTQVQENYADADVEVWTMDEHRVGLKPIIRRMWVDEWTVPVANVNWRFKWLWLYGFVQPQSGETYWWILPFVNTEIFNQVLADFAQHFKLGENKQVVLALDRAGWHTAGKLEVPKGIHIVEMPSHSPELQPAERLWPLTNEPLANRTFENLDELEEVLFERCKQLLQQQDLIRGLTNFHWWPQVPVSA
jgi:transposase